MPEAYVIDAVRTAVGKRNGSLAGIHPIDLGVRAFRGIFARNDVDPAAVDDAIVGCVDAIGGQAGNIGRLAWLAAGYPEEVPGVTVDRQCGSSQQAISFGAQAIMAGVANLILAGGMQNMSQIPISSAMIVGQQFGFSTPTAESKMWLERYGDQEISQFRGAEMIAQLWDISREDMERWALASHERAFAAIQGGHFTNEIVPVDGFAVDETPRQTTLEKMAALPPLSGGGRMTAAVASQISDGASAVLLASEQAVREHGLTPRARIHHMSCRGADPVLMLTGPIPATRYALDRTGLSIDDIDLVEINEAFAPVVLAWLKETGADPARVNPNGGAIALGHPLGATGAKLFATMLNELERTGGRYGLQTMCEGGGTANVTIIERLDRMEPITQVSSREVYRNDWMVVREDRIRRGDGSMGLFSVVDKPSYALIIALDAGRVRLVEQYRYPLGGRRWEFPRGAAPRLAEMEPMALAALELREETGLIAGTMMLLGRLDLAPGMSSQRGWVFLATDIREGDPDREHEEQDMRSAWFTRDQVEAMILAGEITDAQSVAAYAQLLLVERQVG